MVQGITAYPRKPYRVWARVYLTGASADAFGDGFDGWVLEKGQDGALEFRRRVGRAEGGIRGDMDALGLAEVDQRVVPKVGVDLHLEKRTERRSKNARSTVEDWQ